MADNDTQVHASTSSVDSDNQLIMYRYAIIIYTCTAMTTVTLLYGVISWWLIEKFRNYRNFVFLNATFANFLVVVIVMSCSYVLKNISNISGTLMYQQFYVLNFFLFLYISTVKVYWLIVICHMFYVDIVKVFNGHIKSRHFKSGLFAWGLPFVTSVMYTYIIAAVANIKSDSSEILFFSFALPMILNSLLFITIICALFRRSDGGLETVTSKWRRLYIATLIFLLSDTLMFSTYIFKFFKPSVTTAFQEHLVNVIINPLIMYVYFIFVKRNRVLWYEFYVNKINKRQRNRDMKMAVKNVGSTTESSTCSY